jgi:hypothetical protein
LSTLTCIATIDSRIKATAVVTKVVQKYFITTPGFENENWKGRKNTPIEAEIIYMARKNKTATVTTAANINKSSANSPTDFIATPHLVRLS